MSGSEPPDDVWVLAMLDYGGRRLEPLRMSRSVAVDTWDFYETLEEAQLAAALKVLSDGS